MCSQKLHKKLFGEVWGNSGKTPSQPQKFAFSSSYDEKSPPLLPVSNDRGMNAPAMPPSSGVPVHIILHALPLLIVVGYNLSL